MTKALIIGAGGQDGPYLANYLRGLGYEIMATLHPLDNVEVFTWRAPGIAFGLIDTNDPTALQRRLASFEPDEIYALAALSSPATAAENPILAIRSACDGLLVALEWMRAQRKIVKMFHASSVAIFGRAQPPQNAVTPTSPTGIYGVSKLLGHNIVRCYRDQYSLFVVSGILSNHESIWRQPWFVSRKITRAVASRDKLILGNPNAVRDWGYAGDTVRAMHLLLAAQCPTDVVIGTGQGMTVELLAELSYGIADQDFRDYVTFTEAPDDTDAFVADPEAIQALGWRPKTNIDQVVEKMVSADTLRREGVSDRVIAEMELAGHFLPA